MSVQGWARSTGDSEEAMSRLSEKLGQSRFWLYKAIDPNDNKHKLSPEQLNTVMETTGDLSPLELQVSRFGKRLVDIQAEPNAPTMDREVIEAHAAVGEYLRHVDDPTIPYEDDRPRLDAAMKELEDCFVRKRNRQGRDNKTIAKFGGTSGR